MWALILCSELGAEVLIQHILLGHAQPVQVLDGVGDEAPGAADVELALSIGDETGQGALAIFRVHILRRNKFKCKWVAQKCLVSTDGNLSAEKISKSSVVYFSSGGNNLYMWRVSGIYIHVVIIDQVVMQK